MYPFDVRCCRYDIKVWTVYTFLRHRLFCNAQYRLYDYDGKHVDKRTAVLRQKSKLVTQICTIILQESSSPCFVFCIVSSQTIFIADYNDFQKARTVNMVCYILLYFLNSWIFVNYFLREFARKNVLDMILLFSANIIRSFKRKMPSTDVPCYYSKKCALD